MTDSAPLTDEATQGGRFRAWLRRVWRALTADEDPTRPWAEGKAMSTGKAPQAGGSVSFRMSRPSVQLRFVPGDLWIGAFVERERVVGWKGTRWSMYVCLLPCFPVRFRWIWWDSDLRWPSPMRRRVARERCR